MYVDDNHVYPYWEFTDWSDHARVKNWGYVLRPYYPIEWTNSAYHCPAYKGAISAPMSGLAWDDGGFHGSYSYNTFGAVPYYSQPLSSPEGRGLGLGDTQLVASSPVRESEVLMPSEMFAMMDSRGESRPPVGYIGADYTWCGAQFAGAYTAVPPQHGKNFNVSSCDGHVSAVKLTPLFNPANTAANWNRDHAPHPELWP